MRKSPEDRIWLMSLVLDGLQALPNSNEEYVARAQGELEQLVRFFRSLHNHELERGNESMKDLDENDDGIGMRDKKFFDELHSALSTSISVFGKNSAAVKVSI